MNSIEFKNRLLKRLKHRQKWAKRTSITCFRLYQHDLPDVPCIVDYLDGDIVAWIHPRQRDDTEKKQVEFQSLVQDVLESVFGDARVFIKGRSVQQGAQQYEKLSSSSITKQVTEGGVIFELNLSDYLDVGLFLDHRRTRDYVRKHSKGKRVLNLYAYTGSFSCYAIDGGSRQTVSVDLSPKYRY